MIDMPKPDACHLVIHICILVQSGMSPHAFFACSSSFSEGGAAPVVGLQDGLCIKCLKFSCSIQ